MLCDLGEYGKAAQTLQRASSLYRRMGDSHLNGVTVPRQEREKKVAEGKHEEWQGAFGIG